MSIDDEARRAQAQYERALEAAQADDLSAARTHLERAVEGFTQGGDVAGRAAAMVMLGQILAKADQLSEGLPVVREAVSLLEGLGSPELASAQHILQTMEAMARGEPLAAPGRASLHRLLQQSHDALHEGRLKAAEEGAVQARLLAQALDDAEAEATAGYLLGTARLQSGRPGQAVSALQAAAGLLASDPASEALQLIQQTLALAQKEAEMGTADLSPSSCVNQALLELQKNQPDAALELARVARLQLTGVEAAMAVAVEARALVCLERWDEADDAVRAATDLAADDPNIAGQIQSLAAHVQLSKERRQLASTSVETVRASAPPEARGARLLAKARADAHFGQTETAFVAFEAARAEAEASEDSRLQLEVRLQRAVVYATDAQPEAASADLEAAQTLANDLDADAKTAVEQARQILRTQKASPSPANG